jgi:microcystin degradation protein MlrC
MHETNTFRPGITEIDALKSRQHVRGGFSGVAGEIFRTDLPGASTSTLSSLPYQRV